MGRTIKGMVVVITGASSGIGRATALQFARGGAHVALAARDADALGDAADDCSGEGQTMVVQTDVTDEASVERLRDAVLERFGRIDVWINDAAAYMMGSVEDTPAEAVRQLFETNVLGVLHGMRAALHAFRQAGRGVLINVGSVAGKVPYAYTSAYSASKHAVHALTEALRQELVGTRIHACIVAPATVDTPLFQHAANYTGRRIEAMRPIYTAERVAEAIVSCALRPRREVLVGNAPRVMSAMMTFTPAIFERVQPKLVEKEHLGKTRERRTAGNLAHPIGPHRISGGWRAKKGLPWTKILGAAAAAVPLLLVGMQSTAVRRALGA